MPERDVALVGHHGDRRAAAQQRVEPDRRAVARRGLHFFDLVGREGHGPPQEAVLLHGEGVVGQLHGVPAQRVVEDRARHRRRGQSAHRVERDSEDGLERLVADREVAEQHGQPERSGGRHEAEHDEEVAQLLAACSHERHGRQEEAPEPEPQPQQEEIVSFSTSTEVAGCPDDLYAVDGMPGCCVPDPTFLGDGACDAYEDSPYNTAACFWDRGDCCHETCDKNTDFGCAAKEGDEFGPFGFYCLDPRYSIIDDEACDAANKEWIGDGGCDPEYNTQAVSCSIQ